MTGKLRRRLMATTLGAGVVASLALTAPAALAASAPNQSLSGTASSFSTTNNSVTALATAGGVLYAGGEFTSVTPPGGSSEARTYLAAFSTTTGQPTSFDPTLNGRVNALTMSPDGSTLYIAGTFTKVNGSTRNHFAAFTVSTGALSAWNPNAGSGNGYAVAATSTAVYLGGTFGTVGGTAHADLASVNTTTGTLNTAFTATADGEIDSMALPSNGSQLVVAGYFNTLAGVSEHAIGSVNPTTGAANPWGANNVMPNTQQCLSTGAVVTISGSTAYIGANGQQGGCYDGDFAAALTSDPTNSGNGALLWNSTCEGATAALTVLNGVLYKGSHMHDCSYNPGGAYGGFSGSLSRSTFTFYRLIAQDPSNGSFIHWSPNTNGANDTTVGPLAMANDGTRLFLGGDFTTVNGSAREGLAVFAPTSITPSAAPKTPTVAPLATPGADDVTVTFPADTDTDNGVLTYTIYRGTSTQVGQVTAESWPWAQPTLRFTDTGLTPGSSYTYHYKVSDGTSTTSSSPNSASATVLSSVPSYQSTVSGDHPSVDWRLDETSGNTAADSSGNGVTGQYNSGDTLNQPGAVGSDAAITTDGSTGYVASNSPLSASAGFTESAWFKTSSVSGGTIMGDSTTQSPSAGTADDGVWLDDDGQVNFDITAPMPTGPPSPTQVPPSPLRSANSYNDGQWHQVVATYDGTTQNLYIDGTLVGTQAYTATNPFRGYVVAGYDNLNSFMHVFGQNTTTETAPNSYYFNGGLDEVAAYPAALSATQVSTLWQGNADLGGGGGGSPTPGQVTGVGGTATSSSVSLTWNAVSGATSYEVERSSTSATSGYQPLTTTDSTNAYTDNTVNPSTNYWYEVTASNGTTQGATSAAYAISTPGGSSTPGQVTNVNGNATSSSVSLTWNAVSGATSYEVERSSTSATSGYQPLTTTDSTNAYTDNTVNPSTNYWYEVTASNGTTQGATSAAYAISTPGGSSGGTALLANSFEGGSNGTALTAANSGSGSGNKFNTVSCSGGAATYSSSNPAHGSLAGNFAPSTSACYVQWTSGSIPTTTTSYGRMYVNEGGTGTNTVVLAKLATSAGVRDAQIEINTSGKLTIYDANNAKQATSTNSVPTGWVRIEWTLVNSTTAGSLSVSMYNGDSTTPIETITANGINTGAGFGNLALGSVVATKTALSPFQLDDVAYGTSGPLGPGS